MPVDDSSRASSAWTRHKDEASNQFYVVNTITGESKWEINLVSEHSSSEVMSVPTEQKQKILEDETGRKYMWDMVTGKTAWLD